MFRVITNIKITQQPTDDFPKRNRVINLDFVHRFECNDTWVDMTNKGRVVIPKNLYFVDENGKTQALKGTNINLGGFGFNPLILKGDKIDIEAGYRYFDSSKRELTDTSNWFTGWISKVSPKVPIELSIEDNMWKLKQTPVKTHTFKNTDTLETILKFITQGTGFTVMSLAETTFGDSFVVGNETAAQVLNRLKSEYGFRSYFRGNELRCGTLMYLPEEAITHTFIMVGNKGNVIKDSNDLEYVRKDDIVLSAIAYNTLTVETGQSTKDGKKKTKKVRLEVLVTIRNGKRQPDLVVSQGDVVPENLEGERRTLFFPGATTSKKLGDLAYEELKKYYYNGLKGSFQTFGIPFVKMGDNARVINNVMPELDGVYKIKDVNREGGVNGLKQTLHLDYRLNSVQ